jgi:hypothetical protein
VNRLVALIVLLVSGGAFLVLSICAPWTLSDSNAFLSSFVGADFLSLMGIIVTISVASATNLQIEMNKMEERAGFVAFQQSRHAIRESTYALLWSLLFAVVVVVVKPLATSGAIVAALFNSAALLIALFSGLLLADLVASAFGLSAIIREEAVDQPEE